ncbi:MAG TPA: 2-amino-4-hydroxy-6-hydroxymethyldihydropteridine diphosphokinase [Candidatus Fimivicinus intestinavium]|nr:2-amino-4-hydroxy-6-hydroxymethyldihydropteridine diphosphokinase [Candidatus Fimivicinus intestinavium]
MNTAIIGMGSNLGDRLDTLNRAVKAIALLPRTKVVNASHLYETEPVGYAEQGPFLNANLMVETDLSPMALLGGCLGIEAAFGRERTVKNGPRVLDLDLLLYEGMRSDSFELTLPHPRILERAFVMVPLMDLYPSGRAPGLYFAPHLKEIGSAGVERVQEELAL